MAVQRRAFVTGASGFIGRHLVRHLLANGWDVTAFCRTVSRDSTLPFEPPVRTFYGDICDHEAIREALSIANPSAIYHLAAKHSVDNSYVEHIEHFRVNAFGTYVLASAAMQLVNPPLFVNMGSSEVYGNQDKLPIDEQAPLRPQSPYAAAKAAGEMALRGLHASFTGKLYPVYVRGFNVYGPEQSDRAVIPHVIRQMLRSNSVCLGNFKAARDWTYVEDTVRALRLVAEQPIGHVAGETFNIAFGETVSLQEVCDLAAAILRVNPVLAIDQKQTRPEASEVWTLCGSNVKASQFLGWSPKVRFWTGLERVIEWERSRLSASSTPIPA